MLSDIKKLLKDDVIETEGTCMSFEGSGQVLNVKFVFLTWKNVQFVDMEKCPFSMTCLLRPHCMVF